nr:O-antigen ligase family protein [Rhodococcus sp. MEB064]
MLFVVALVLSYNRNSLIAVLLSIVLVVLLRRDQWRLWRVSAVAVLLVFFGKNIFTAILEYLFDGDLAGARSGTGRTSIWSRLLSVSDEWSGWGLGLAWNSDAASFSLARSASLGQPAENSLLDSWITGGAAAALVLLILLFALLVSVLTADIPLQSKIIFICASATAGMVTSGLMGTSAPSVVLLLLAGLPRSSSRSKRQWYAGKTASGGAPVPTLDRRGRLS